MNVPTAIDAYYDDVFLATILRTCSARETRWFVQDELVAERIAALDELDVSDALIGEIALAALRGIVPPGPVLPHLRARRKVPELGMMLDLLDTLAVASH